jgi:hypothetical protein
MKFDYYHGLNADPSITWTFYSPASGSRLTTSKLRSPQFQVNGTVVELDRSGIAAYRLSLDSGEPDLRLLGRVDLPANTGIRVAGEQLLVRQGRAERYRSFPRAERINAGSPGNRAP